MYFILELMNNERKRLAFRSLSSFRQRHRGTNVPVSCYFPNPRPRTNDRKRLETNQFKPDTYSVINTSLRIQK